MWHFMISCSKQRRSSDGIYAASLSFPSSITSSVQPCSVQTYYQAVYKAIYHTFRTSLVQVVRIDLRSSVVQFHFLALDLRLAWAWGWQYIIRVTLHTSLRHQRLSIVRFNKTKKRTSIAAPVTSLAEIIVIHCSDISRPFQYYQNSERAPEWSKDSQGANRRSNTPLMRDTYMTSRAISCWSLCLSSPQQQQCR